jgi:hypothetical protein
MQLPKTVLMLLGRGAAIIIVIVVVVAVVCYVGSHGAGQVSFVPLHWSVIDTSRW